MSSLKNKRSLIKAALTRFVKQLEQPTFVANIKELKLRLEKFELIYDQFNAIPRRKLLV